MTKPSKSPAPLRRDISASSLCSEDAPSASTLKVLSLNCWGVPVAPFRAERMSKIAEVLSEASDDGKGYDVICLQEVWLTDDFELLVSQLPKPSPFKFLRRFRSGFLGSGLVVLSRLPVVSASFTAFNSSGKMYKPWHADALGGKGFARVVVDCGAKAGLVEIFTLHTQAQYKHIPPFFKDSEYGAVRLSQMVQLAQAIRNSKYSSQIVVGDFNALPDSLEMRLFLEMTGLNDAYSLFINSSSKKKIKESEEAGHTSRADNIFNRVSSIALTWGIPVRRGPFFPSRIDYAFYTPQSGILKGCKPCLADPVVSVSGGRKVPLSDHSGLELILDMDPKFREVFAESPEADGVLTPSSVGSSTKVGFRKSDVFVEAITELDRADVVAGKRADRIGLIVILALVCFLLWNNTIVRAGALGTGILFALVYILALPAERATLRQTKAELELFL